MNKSTLQLHRVLSQIEPTSNFTVGKAMSQSAFDAEQTASRSTAHLKITVAALTRRRPKMLAQLLRSLGEMNIPDNCTVSCLIVENDQAPDSQELVASCTPLSNGLTVDYVLEQKAGISFGRNRAAKKAIASGSNLMTFVDDDETVANDWLTEIVGTYRTTNCCLIGGPVRFECEADNLSFLEAAMLSCIERDNANMNVSRETSIQSGMHPRDQVFTNNWLGETLLFSQHNIWFDEELALTGGEDTQFSIDVKSKGIPVGWSKNAVVTESVPRERLSFRYQRRRQSGRHAQAFEERIKKRPLSRYSLILRLPRRSIGVVLLALSLPFNRGKNLLILAERAGWITGRVNVALGRRVELYKNVTGD